ncbi:Competence protein ComM [bioreactor metagenome]|uniref:Competence protein ComM n=1 Tax=bioreactor metagenome TaxID=1076179 RepID=A0A645I4A4_9ZZZZ
MEVRQLTQDELLKAPDGEPSAVIRERVIAARAIQSERFKGQHFNVNARMAGRHLQQYCQLPPTGQVLLRQAITRFKLSPRAYDRILKVTRTIADLSNSPDIREEHLFEAISYRKAALDER